MHLCFHQRAPTGCAHLQDLISISASRKFIRKTVSRAAADQFMMLSGSEQPATCALKTRFLYLIVPAYVASVSISMVTFYSRNPHCTSWGTVELICWWIMQKEIMGDTLWNGTYGCHRDKLLCNDLTPHARSYLTLRSSLDECRCIV